LLLIWTVRQFVSRRAGKPKSCSFSEQAISGRSSSLERVAAGSIFGNVGAMMGNSAIAPFDPITRLSGDWRNLLPKSELFSIVPSAPVHVNLVSLEPELSHN
jgi:hypothetical protein